MLAHLHDGPLVDAGRVVGAGKLGELAVHHLAVVLAHGDVVGGHLGDRAGGVGDHSYLRVHAVLVLLAGGHDGSLGGEQGHGLALHVRAHQGAVGVVVFQEGDHGRRDGHHHLGGHVDVVHVRPVHRDDLVAAAAGDTVVEQIALLIGGLGGLGHGVLVLYVGGHVDHLVGDPPRLLVDLAEGGLQEAEAVHPGVGGHIGDQSDVGTFGGLDGAQAAIVGIVDVADLEGGPVTAQTAGAQSGHTALVGQLRQGVGLVHELAQGAGAKELLDGRGDGPDIDEALGGDNIQVLDGHALPNDTLHAGKADAELVLEQLAHAAQAAVAQMVDVVRGAYAHGQAVEVVDGGHHVLNDDVLGDQVVHALPDGLLEVLPLIGVLLQQLTQHVEAHLLVHPADLLGVEGDKIRHVYHAVGEHLDHMVLARLLHNEGRPVHALGLQGLGLLPGEDLPRLGQHLAGDGVHHVLRQAEARQTARNSQLLVELIAAHRGQIIAAGVEEQRVQKALGGIHRGRLTWAELAVDLQHGVLIGLAGVLLQGGHDAGILAKQLQDLRVGLGTHGADKGSHRQLAVLVDANIEHVGKVGLILQPCSTVGNDRGGIGQVLRLVGVAGIVDAGRAHQLGDNDTLRAVDDKRARVGHQGQVTHKDLLLLDLLGLLVAQAHLHLDRRGIIHVPALALVHVVLGLFVHRIVDEGQLQVARVVGDGGHIPEHLPKALLQEPPVGVFLHLQQVGHLQDLLVAGKALS